jgi:branched-subunit amino acid aminotransferase/4-amino-4-deoxychorismate lyase
VVHFLYETAFCIGEIKLFSMNILFNGNLLEGAIPWSPHDRAFQYGDGFFETMLFRDGEVPLLNYHLDRMSKAAEIYRFDLPVIEFRFLVENIQTLVQLNEIESPVIRAKLMIWRRASAQQQGYRTHERHVNWALMVSEHSRPFFQKGLRVGFSKGNVIPIVPWSGVKSMNALPYVFASMECEERALDDLILLNQNGYPAEGIASNVFWKLKGRWYTPAAETGCILGTMRSFILKNGLQTDRQIEEWNAPLKETPEAAFLCNSMGISSISEWNGKEIADCLEEIRSSFENLVVPL